MKQLELQVNIRKIDDDLWEIVACPKEHNKIELSTWCWGSTYQEVINRFYEMIANTTAKYWFMLKEFE